MLNMMEADTKSYDLLMEEFLRQEKENEAKRAQGMEVDDDDKTLLDKDGEMKNILHEDAVERELYEEA